MVIQKLWVGTQVEVGEDCGSLEVGCTRPLRAISENFALCFRCRRCQLSRYFFRQSTEAIQTVPVNSGEVESRRDGEVFTSFWKGSESQID